MAPLSTENQQAQSIWTPDIIATIVYRVMMVIVSLIYIWRKTYYSPRPVDGMEQLRLFHLQLLAAQTSTSQSPTHEPIDSITTTNPSTNAADIMAVAAQSLGSVVSTVLNGGNNDGLSFTFNSTPYGVPVSPERAKHRASG